MNRVILADPPWPEKSSMVAPSPKASRGGAKKHYNLMTLDEIKRCELPPLDPSGCFLWLWCPFRKIQNAIEVIKAWGFKYNGSSIIWVKTNKKGLPTMGQGYYIRICHEVLLLGVKGKPERWSYNTRSVVLHPKMPRHSQKPPIFYDIIEAYSPGPYFEMFARERRTGWNQSGLELPAIVNEHTLDGIY